ncbi:MAG: hypothetical protein N3E38_02620 [Candidatus Aenigmarchaeota archaeon]|nr:hypothetical protein [Candidatus Aenigmarchaeota archaeon]
MSKLWFGFAKYGDNRREFDLNFFRLILVIWVRFLRGTFRVSRMYGEEYRIVIGTLYVDSFGRYWLKASGRSYLLEYPGELPPSLIGKEVYVFCNKMEQGHPPRVNVVDIAISLRYNQNIQIS